MYNLIYFIKKLILWILNVGIPLAILFLVLAIFIPDSWVQACGKVEDAVKSAVANFVDNVKETGNNIKHMFKKEKDVSEGVMPQNVAVCAGVNVSFVQVQYAWDAAYPKVCLFPLVQGGNV